MTAAPTTAAQKFVLVGILLTGAIALFAKSAETRGAVMGLDLVFDAEEPKTSGSSKLRAIAPVSEKSLEELVGELMAATARNTAATNDLGVQVGTLTRELTQHMRASELREETLPEVTKRAATQGSNRLALLVTAFVTIYEIAAPTIRELLPTVLDLVRWVHG